MADEPQGAGAPTGRRRLNLIIGVAVVALVAVGVSALYYTAGQESTDDAQVDAHVVPIAARVGGTILRMPVKTTSRSTLGRCS